MTMCYKRKWEILLVYMVWCCFFILFIVSEYYNQTESFFLQVYSENIGPSQNLEATIVKRHHTIPPNELLLYKRWEDCTYRKVETMRMVPPNLQLFPNRQYQLIIILTTDSEVMIIILLYRRNQMVF